MSGATSGPLILVSCVMVPVVVFFSVNSGEQSGGFFYSVNSGDPHDG